MLVGWYSWLKRGKGTRAGLVSSGYQEAVTVVKGGSSPDRIGPPKSSRRRFLFFISEAVLTFEVALP